jgi:hypothetical protein
VAQRKTQKEKIYRKEKYTCKVLIIDQVLLFISVDIGGVVVHCC